MAKHFWRFTLLQLVILISLLCLLLGMGVRYIRPLYQERMDEQRIQQKQRASLDFKIAVANNDPSLARDAMARGANVDDELKLGSLNVCIRAGHVEMLACLLETCLQPVEVFSSGSGTHYVRAALASEHPLKVRKAMLDLMIEHGVEIHATAEVQKQWMDVAVSRRDAGLCDLLRDYGVAYGPREMAVFNRLAELKAAIAADSDLLNQRVADAHTRGDLTLLGIALSHGHYEMAQFLVASGAPLDTREESGRTPMHMAARGGSVDCVRLIADHGGDVNARDDWNDTPLTDSIWHAHVGVDVVRLLIDLGADVNAQQSGGRTALHLVLSHGRCMHVPVLLAAGADPQIKDRQGLSALEHAKDCPPEIQSLLKSAD